MKFLINAKESKNGGIKESKYHWRKQKPKNGRAKITYLH